MNSTDTRSDNRRLLTGAAFCRARLAASHRATTVLLLAIILVASFSKAVAQNTKQTYDLSGNLITKAASGSLAAPQIVGQPQQQVLEPGKTATFSVALADAQGVTYQWRFNGNPITGATNDSLVLTNVTAANEGLYSVFVSNSAGNATSNAVHLYIDSRGCGMPDSWQLQYFGNLTQPATGDFDGDGVSNLQEFLDGTDPTSNTSFKTSLTIETDGGGSVTVSPVKTRYNQADVVTLTAVPFAGNSFHGWSGDATGTTNPINVTMSANRTVFAHFLAAPLPVGAISWWQAENNALDAMGTNNGALVNGVSFGNGKVGKAFNFNGTNQSVDVPDSPSLRPNSVTLEAWVSMNNTSGLQTIFAKPLGGGSLDSYTLYVQNGSLNGAISNSNGFGNFISATFNPAAGIWHHVAFTFDNATKVQALYVDGSQVATNSAGAGMTIGYDSQPMLLGRDIDGGVANYFFNGAIDEATIYNRALSSDELASIYAADVSGKIIPHPYFTSPLQLPDGIQSTNYSYQLTATGTNPITYSLGFGGLPPGLNMSGAGLISGTPTSPGVYSFTVHVTDAIGSSDQLVTIKIIGPVMPAGLVGWWRAENNAQDSVGTNHGTLVGGATFAAGEIGQAFSLNGTTAYVQIPDSPALRPSSLTVETWVMFAAPASGIEVFVAKPLGSGTADSYSIWWQNGSLYCTFNDINGAGPFVSAGFTPNVGQWYHVACTYDATTLQASLYLNGTLVAGQYANLTIGYDTQALLFGRDQENGSAQYFFNGRVDEVSLYNRALSSTEIASVYAAGAAGKVASGPYINSVNTLTDGLLNQSYNQTIMSVRGTAPITYSVVSGNLPPGLSLSSSGVLSGTPTVAGSYTFTIRATDNANLHNDQTFTIAVYARTAPAAGIVSWWRGENNANDSIGTNNGTLVNGVTFAPGKVGQAFFLAGNNNYIDVPDAASLRPASITLETWVSFNYAGGVQVILAKPLGSGILDSYGVWLENGNLKGAICDANNFAQILAAPFVPQIGRWYHVAYTFDDSTKQQALYLDGVQVAFGEAPTSIGYDNHAFTIGHDVENGASQFYVYGRVDEVALYNRALSAAEIAAIQAAGSAGRTASGPYFSTLPALPDAVALLPYSQSLTSLRGTGAVNFSIVGGVLPGGLALSTNGLISGTPTTVGSYSFVVRATDSNSTTADQTFTLTVVPKIGPPAGIISWWRAENNANDSIGTNPGALNGGATFATGKVGKAFALDGVNGYISIPDSVSLHPSSLTVEGWVNFFSTNGSPPIFSKHIGGGGQDSFTVWLFNGNLNAYITDANQANTSLAVPFSPVPGQWYHVAFTFDNVTKQQLLYVNGAIIGGNISNRQIGYDNHPMLLGAEGANANPTYFLNGRIDEAAIYGRALTASEIAALYNTGGGGKTSAGPYFTIAPQLPDGAVGVTYSQTFTSVRGTNPVTYSLNGGTLPSGLSLAANGSLTGTPTIAGDYSFAVRATDASSQFLDQTFVLHIGTRSRIALGAVSWWRAEGNALDVFATNNGTLSGGASYAAGRVGQAFSLDGLTGTMSAPDAPSLRPTSLTLEAWVEFEAANAIRTIFAKTLGGGNLDSYGVWIENGVLHGTVADTNGEGPRLSYPFTPVPGRWYHIAYTFDGVTKQQMLYVDSAIVAIGTGDRVPAYDTHPFLLGSDIENGNPAYFHQGRIDEAAIYNRALTSAEIAGIYGAGSAGKRQFFPIETWKLTNLGDPDAPNTGDPDHDGVPNLIEYAFGMNPTVADVSALPQVSVFNYPEGRRLRIIFPRDPTKNDVTIEVQATGDLTANWTTIASSVLGAPTSGIGYVGGDGPGPGIKQVEVRDIVNMSDAPRRFLRIRISQ